MVIGPEDWYDRAFEHDIIDRLKVALPGLSDLGQSRIRLAHQDLVLTAALDEELQKSVQGLGWADRRLLFRHEQRTALLKALYGFAGVFVAALLSEVARSGPPPGEITLTRRTSDGKKLLAQDLVPGLDFAAILPAYCVVQYRNKLVMHHDVRRYGNSRSDRDGTIWLVPVQPDLISAADSKALGRLAAEYQGRITGLVLPENASERLTALFYAIPLLAGDMLNPDRAEVDRIAERGGCDSLSRQGVVAAVDSFAAAVVCTRPRHRGTPLGSFGGRQS